MCDVQLYSSRCFDLPVTGLGFSPLPIAGSSGLISNGAQSKTSGGGSDGGSETLAACSADYRLAIIPKKKTFPLNAKMLMIVSPILILLALLFYFIFLKL